MPPPLPSAAESGGRRFPCARCGAKLEYLPGTESLGCPYCGHRNAIPAAANTVIEELSFDRFLRELRTAPETADITLVKCQSCGAEIEKPPEVSSLACPYCSVDVVMTLLTKRIIKPQALLPFRISSAQARGAFQKWIQRRWFAPTALKKLARMDNRLHGLYTPFWTYDARTTSYYSGARGDDYYVPQTVTVRVNGRVETRTVMVRHTRWRNVSGTVRNAFDDLLVVASHSLPREHVDEIDPWDLHELTPYRDEYLSGFSAENYQVDLPDGFEQAKELMAGPIHASVIRDIGGDHQQIHSIEVQYSNITFKHILLPLWISAYRYRDRVFRFLVNARTGEVRGDRPWSWIKITFAVLLAAAIIATIAAIIGRNEVRAM